MQRVQQAPEVLAVACELSWFVSSFHYYCAASKLSESGKTRSVSVMMDPRQQRPDLLILHCSLGVPFWWDCCSSMLSALSVNPLADRYLHVSTSSFDYFASACDGRMLLRMLFGSLPLVWLTRRAPLVMLLTIAASLDIVVDICNVIK